MTKCKSFIFHLICLHFCVDDIYMNICSRVKEEDTKKVTNNFSWFVVVKLKNQIWRLGFSYLSQRPLRWPYSFLVILFMYTFGKARIERLIPMVTNLSLFLLSVYHVLPILCLVLFWFFCCCYEVLYDETYISYLHLFYFILV